MTGKAKTTNIILLLLAIVAFCISCALYVLTKKSAFAFVNGGLLLLTSFLFKGRLRTYSVIFAIGSSDLFIPYNSNVGSLLTYYLFVYLLFVLLTLFSNPSSAVRKAPLLASHFILTVFVVVSLVANHANTTILKAASALLYWSLPLMILLDKKAPVNLFGCIVSYGFSILFGNIFAFFFLYIYKSQALSFLEIFMPAYVHYYKVSGLSSFRFGGLVGDSNGNAFRILLVLVFSMCSLRAFKQKERIITVILSLALQPFALLGASKTYLLCVVFLALFSLVYLYRKNRKLLGAALFSLTFGLLAFILFGGEIMLKFLNRFLAMDTRVGFLSAITTYRSDIFEVYFSNLVSQPGVFLFGRGVRAVTQNQEYYHNLYLQSLYDLGLVGCLVLSAAWLTVFRDFTFVKKAARCNFLILALIGVFGLSLHLLYMEAIPISIIVMYCRTKHYDFYEDLTYEVVI